MASWPAADKPARRRGRRLAWVLLGTGLAIGGCTLAVAAWLGHSPVRVYDAMRERSAGDVVRHLQRRLDGHTQLEVFVRPVLDATQRLIERPVQHTLPTDMVKGQQRWSLPSQRYAPDGRPEPVSPESAVRSQPSLPAATVSASDLAALSEFMQKARPGDVLELMPGRYPLARTLWTGTAGTRERPIVVRAAVPGQVTLESATVQAFNVSQPHWVFENLVIRGACADEADCEHAFHVVAAARGTVLRNNRMIDFNAHVKVNGQDGSFPDDGLMQFNTLVNQRPRRTGKPVTPFDLVAAHGWQVMDNLVADFVRPWHEGGVTYGIFMKGASERGRIERNLVVCTTRGISQPGQRVGISLGGGETGADACRDRRCAFEHAAGVVANNVVAHCNDAGIDLNRAIRSTVVHNTLVNTAGILARGEPTFGLVQANLLEGRVMARGESQLLEQDNRHLDWSDLVDAGGLDLRWKRQPGTVSVQPLGATDFCGSQRSATDLPGALASTSTCLQGQAGASPPR